MNERTNERAYDVVLFGATGFTGALTAEYLARNAPVGCRWAIAGRNTAKLEATRSTLAAINPELKTLGLLNADVADPDSLRKVAASSRVVISTVGPYALYGEPLVAACADAGTDYVDLTGEPAFVDEMFLRYNEKAKATGARLVHSCGFDSIPHDLGVYFTVQQLPTDLPIRVRGVVRAGARPSGGTVHSALLAFSRWRATAETAAKRRRKDPRPPGRRIRLINGKPHRDKQLGLWAVPLPTIDPVVVARSACALERYGPDFSYSHYVGFKRLPIVVGGLLGVGLLFGAAQVPPLRKALLARLPAGDGPSVERRAGSWFRVKFVGEGGGQRVIAECSGGDPGYTETSKMLAESALSLAFDDNPKTAGQVTTAVAMGDALTRRLINAGLVFRVVESGKM